MRTWAQQSGRCVRRPSPHPNAAFSLIELMVVVTILSALFVLAVPTYQRMHRKAKAAAVGVSFQTFGAAIQSYAHEKGAWPLEVGIGVIPPGMTPEELKYDDWMRKTPIGGKFDWENNQVHPGGPGGRWKAAITIAPTSDAPLVIDGDQFLEIDRAIDDGDLATGAFRTGTGAYPIYILEN